MIGENYMNIEYLSKKITNYIIKKGIIANNDYELYQYGFQCFLELSISTICSIIIALILKMLPECILFFLFFIPLRSYNGGLHLKTYIACFLSSCMILITTLLAVKYIDIPIKISFITLISCIISIKIIGPVNHPNRKVNNSENKIFIWKTNISLLLSFFSALLFLYLKKTSFLLLETIVFVYLLFTTLIGKFIYKQH